MGPLHRYGYIGKPNTSHAARSTHGQLRRRIFNRYLPIERYRIMYVDGHRGIFQLRLHVILSMSHAHGILRQGVYVMCHHVRRHSHTRVNCTVHATATAVGAPTSVSGQLCISCFDFAFVFNVLATGFPAWATKSPPVTGPAGY